MPPDRPRRKGKRQRFYARNAVKTTLDPRNLDASMRSLWASRAPPLISDPSSSGADQLRRRMLRARWRACWPMWGLWRCLPSSASICGTQLPVASNRAEPAAKAGWSLAEPLASGLRRQPVRFARKNRDLRDFPASRGRPQGHHPLGPDASGRNAGRGTRNLPPRRRIRPIRAGDRRSRRAEWSLSGARELEAAGMIDSKFGTGDAAARIPAQAGSCLGFLKRLDDPNLQISGWSCQGDACRPSAPRSAAC